MRVDANIIIATSHLKDGDDLFFFGPWKCDKLDEAIHVLPEETAWADILVMFKIFSSKGQARKAGWDKPIPHGWTEIKIGKLNHMFWIWKPGAERD
jgi:hypothetical protein